MGPWADSAAVVALAARVETLTDSTRALAALVVATPDTVRDTTWVGLVDRAGNEVPNWHGLTVWMVIGWVVTLVGIGVAASIAVKGWKKAAEPGTDTTGSQMTSDCWVTRAWRSGSIRPC